MNHINDTTVTQNTQDHKGDVASRRLRLRDTMRIALAATAALAVGAAAGLAAGSAPQGVQPPDPATVIPPPQVSSEHAESTTRTARARTARRDAVKWPANPTVRDLKVRGVNIRKFLALGRCEAGHGDGYGGVRFRTPAGWKWQGAYGLYMTTHRSVGHPYGTDAGQMTWQEQTLIAQRVMERYSIHAWGAAHCYIAA